MSDLDRVIDLAIQGEKENAIRLLASYLLKNREDVEAWLLMAQWIDDPARKKDCYRQVLRLVPSSRYARKMLQDLEPAPAVEPPPLAPLLSELPDEQKPTKPSIRTLRQSEPPVQNSPAPHDSSKKGLELVAYVMGGIAVLLVIVYVITSANNFSGDIDDPAGDAGNLFTALLFVGLIALALILSASDRNRG